MNDEKYNEMYKRVKDNIKRIYKDRNTGKYVSTDHNESNLKKMTLVCLENNLYPEKNHLVMIQDKVYITWEGTKWILKQKGIYWEVINSKFDINDDGDCRCEVILGYLPNIYGYSNSMKTYMQFITEYINMGLSVSDIKQYVIPKSVGIGLYRMQEAQFSNRLSDMETMALKRAIFSALNYSQVIDGSIDTLEYGDKIEKTDENVKNDKKITKQKKKKSYSELSLPNENKEVNEKIDNIKSEILKSAFDKENEDDLSDIEKKKYNIWIKNLKNVNVEEINKVAADQLSIYNKVVNNPELGEYLMELLKLKGLKSIFSLNSSKISNEIVESLNNKIQ